MKVSVEKVNAAVVSLIQNPNQIITIDANFFILPNRDAQINVITMNQWQACWLDPLFSCFPNLAIHEAVYRELVASEVKTYADKKLSSTPKELLLHRDIDLSADEKFVRDTKEAFIAQNTKYIPALDNKDDRGEVKTLAYISTKNLLYFASHDDGALKLIANCKALKTSLDEQKAIRMYELLYYLVKRNFIKSKYAKAIYKMQYYLTKNEIRTNPDWGNFFEKMDSMYTEYLIN